MKTCIAFLTKDRTELTEQTAGPVLVTGADILWCDGSSTEQGQRLPYAMVRTGGNAHARVMSNVVGGPDAAVAFALTTMLKGSDYTHVGLVENDVLLHRDWYGPTMALFERGAADGLAVGAASARCYEDRVLIQRDGYAVCHNLGWGMVILTREAAQLALKHMRTSWTLENRRLFSQLSGNDIGRYWAFRAGEHMLCADWGNDRILAACGLASLALVPSPVEMIGQDPPLEKQGLKLAQAPVELLRDDSSFSAYSTKQEWIRLGVLQPAHDHFLRDGSGCLYFPHQIPEIGGRYDGDWRLKWTMGFGPFSYRGGDFVDEDGSPRLTVPVLGPVDFIVGGRGSFEVKDPSGYSATPEVNTKEGELISIQVPGGNTYREVVLTALTPGVVLYGLKTQHPQPVYPNVSFDHDTLPPV